MLYKFRKKNKRNKDVNKEIINNDSFSKLPDPLAMVNPVAFMEIKVHRADTGLEEVYKFSSDEEIQKQLDIENEKNYNLRK